MNPAIFLTALLISPFVFSFENNASNIDISTPLIGCVLAADKARTKFIFQLYLQRHDAEFIDQLAVNTRRHFDQEVFKSDIYVVIDTSTATTADFKECIVVGVKEFIAAEHLIASEEPARFAQTDIFVCESMYSTALKLFRKIFAKKWSPLTFLLPQAGAVALPECVTVVKRPLPLLLEREFVDKEYVAGLMARVDARLANSRFEEMTCSTVVRENKTLAAVDEDYEIQNSEEDAELMKKATYYEQVVYRDGELYKLGDYVYARSEKEEENGGDRPPMIVRIDRMWSMSEAGADVYYLRGALFLRPDHIKHEATHLFYKNEVFKEVSREVTISVGQVTVNRETGGRKCSVMNSKAYVSSRITEIDERDTYVCETKYSLQAKTFRKFTKGLKSKWGSDGMGLECGRLQK